MRLKRKCAATKVEEVKTAAGKYQALRVETVYAIEGQKEIRFSEDWYAPGVGLVKQRRLDTNREQLLKSFTPGRD